MSKINVLVLPTDKVGVGKYRSVDPHIKLQELYGDEFHIDIDYNPDVNNDEFWDKYDIIHAHRVIGKDYDKSPSIIKKLKSLGKKVIIDLDDYWLPSKNHPIYALIATQKIHDKIKNNLKEASYVTTTTSIFADHIKKINPNVEIFPNAIDPKEPQFMEKTLPSDKLRIGWLGGSSHLEDIKLLEKSMKKISSIRDNIQICLCGFDVRGSVTEINKETGEKKQRQIKPLETVWYKYEKIFTDNYYNLPKNYVEYLMEFVEDDFEDEENMDYRRVWTRPVSNYAKNYAKFDVSLAPIEPTLFNICKSQLKVIEAGFYKKAIIASDVGPYTIDINHTLDNGNFGDGNGLLVPSDKNNSMWAKYIKILKHNPNYVVELGERLYETVKDKYDLNNVTKNRAEFYKTIMND